MSSARDELEALRAEVRRLRATVQALTEEKKDLEERLAFLAMELERMRMSDVMLDLRRARSWSRRSASTWSEPVRTR